MKAQPKTHRVKVHLLTDPEPERVALVDAGANQEPFRLIKSADVANTTTMTKTFKSEATPDGTEVTNLHKAVFSGEVFADEGAVSAFLTERGYAEFVVKAEDGGGFTVEAAPGDVFESLSVVEVSKGVSYHVGERKQSETKSAAADTSTAGDPPVVPPTEPGATGTSDGTSNGTSEPDTGNSATPPDAAVSVVKAAAPVRVRTRVARNATPVPDPVVTPPVTDEFATRELKFASFVIEKADGTEATVDIKELAQKYDSYGSYASTATTLADVLNEGLMDGVPLGFGELMTAYRYAVRNAVLAGDVAAVKNISWELGLLLVKMASVTTAFTSAKGLSEEDRTTALKALGATEDTFVIDEPAAADPVPSDTVHVAGLAELAAKIDALTAVVTKSITPDAATVEPPVTPPVEPPVTPPADPGTDPVSGATQTRKSAENPDTAPPTAKSTGESPTQTRIQCDSIGLRNKPTQTQTPATTA